MLEPIASVFAHFAGLLQVDKIDYNRQHLSDGVVNGMMIDDG